MSHYTPTNEAAMRRNIHQAQQLRAALCASRGLPPSVCCGQLRPATVPAAHNYRPATATAARLASLVQCPDELEGSSND